MPRAGLPPQALENLLEPHGTNQSNCSVSGTSIASPIVAAAAVLLLSANGNLTPADIGQILQSTAVGLGEPGFDEIYVAGRIDTVTAIVVATTTVSKDNQASTVAIISPTEGEVARTILVDVNYSDNIEVVRVELYVNGQKTKSSTLYPLKGYDPINWWSSHTHRPCC